MVTTYDVAAIYFDVEGVPVQALADANTTGSLVTGGQKLAQRYICRLLLPLGSIPYLPLAGSNFLNFLQTTGHTNENDIFNAFYAAQLNLRPQLQLEEASTDPADEKFRQAILKEVTIAADLLTLTIVILSQANLATFVHLPLRFTVQ